MFDIKDENGELVATIGSARSRKEGFWSEDKTQPLQFAVINCEGGKIFQPHIHKIQKRIPEFATQEFIFVVKGILEAQFFSKNKQLLATKKLRARDFVALYSGGHGFRALSSNALFVEVKTGPYASTEADKERFGDDK